MNIQLTQFQATMVFLRLWGNYDGPKRGAKYRLLPRLIDFNTPKVLSALLNIDIQWELQSTASQITPHRQIPFVQLVSDPCSLGMIGDSNLYLSSEFTIHERLLQYKQGLKVIILLHSQREALQCFLSYRLSVIWRPPGM